MTTKTTKTTVYTDEVVADLVAEYTNANTDETRAEVVQDWADTLGVKVQSVRSKLVNLGVYVAKTRVAKDGSEVETKDKIVADIAKALDVNEERIESLTKATKPVLKLLRTALTASE